MRNNMCEYCNCNPLTNMVGSQNRETKFITTHPDVSITDDILVIIYDGCNDCAFTERINISYCPMCGEKLKK